MPLRPLALLLTAGLVLASGSVDAARRRPRKDTTPPVIEHVPLERHDGAGPVVVEARIVDAQSAIFEPTLLVRLAGTEAYQRVPMTPKPEAPDVYLAPVPPAILVGDVEYLLEVFDEHGNGPARVGEETAPLKIVREVPTAPPPPPPPPPPDGDIDGDIDGEGGPSGLVIGAGVAVGAVILVGAAVGVGFALYALRAPAPEVVTIQVRAPTPVAAGLAPGGDP